MTKTACPICAAPASDSHRPFCSRRCADVDLGRWLTGQYRLPESAEEAGEDGGSLAGEAAPRAGVRNAQA